MKKHDEGYALVLVLVVMIVISLVAASVLTFSLRNLQNQQKSIQRMEDKYAAQGMIEEVVAQLKTDTGITLKNLNDTTSCTLGIDTETKDLIITAKHDTATIVAKIRLTISNNTEPTLDDNIKITDWKYTSYEITYQEHSCNP